TMTTESEPFVLDGIRNDDPGTDLSELGWTGCLQVDPVGASALHRRFRASPAPPLGGACEIGVRPLVEPGSLVGRLAQECRVAVGRLGHVAPHDRLVEQRPHVCREALRRRLRALKLPQQVTLYLYGSDP